MDGRSPWKIGNVTSQIINRNHRSMGYVPIKLTRMGCLMFRHRRDSYATLLPVIGKIYFSNIIEDYNW
jgi:hypothetical protein